MRFRRIVLPALAVVLLALPGAVARAAFPGTNGLIAFERGGDIYTVTTDSAHTVSSSPVVSGATEPAWGPDGKKLAFVQGGSVKVLTVSGGATVTLDTGTSPTFSPNGTMVAYEKGGDIYVISSSGGTGRNLTNSGGTDDDPAWSPDGDFIAFTRTTGGNADIYRMAAPTDPATGGGTSQQQLTTASSNETRPSYSADGDRISFDSDRIGVATRQIYTIPSSGGTEIRETSSASDDTAPADSPDGTLIAFARLGAGIFTTGGGATAITSGVADANPSWQPAAPTNSSLPIISGNFSDGGLMFASTGTFASASSYAYQWQRCDASGNNCSDLSGETASSYRGTSADVGKTLRVRVTASSTSGSTSATSAATPVITGPEPRNATPPRVIVPGTTGVPMAGVTQFSSAGTWTGAAPLTFSYQWKKCQPKEGPCFRILTPAARLSSFVPTADLIGWSLRVEVTATNSSGSATEQSESTPLVVENSPLNTVRPRLSIATTNPTVGQEITVDNGSWSGPGTLTYTYEWRRCDPPGTLPSCKPIPGATSTSYTPTEADLGWTLRAYVTARGIGGSGTAFSDHTFPIIPAPKLPPSVSSPPAVSGETELGGTLTAKRGTWSGFAPMRFVTTWQRCDATVTVCKAVKSAKGLSYVVTEADIGWRIRVVVVGVNAIGSLRSRSDATEPIVLGPPKPKGRVLVGTAKADYIPGGGGDDSLFGRGGSDTLLGGAGDDRIEGGAGNDFLDGGRGKDRLSGGDGSDTIVAADGKVDRVSCGAGNDRVLADQTDLVDADCELVVRGTTPVPEQTP